VRQVGLDKIKEAIDNIHAAGGKNICGPFHSAFATFSRDSPQEDEYKRSAEVLSFSDAIATIGPVMTHVHISENDRGTPGSGNVAWDEVFSSIAKTGYDGYYTVEAFSRDDLDFANAINVWREFNPRMEICRDGYAFTKAMIEKHKIA